MGTSRLPIGGILLLAGLSLLGCIISTDYAEPVPDKAVPLLLQVLKDPDPSQRQTAAQSLGKIGRKEALPALIEAFHDPDPGVRRQAAWAVGMIGTDSTSARQSLIPLLFDDDPGVRESASPAIGRSRSSTFGSTALRTGYDQRYQAPRGGGFGGHGYCWKLRDRGTIAS